MTLQDFIAAQRAATQQGRRIVYDEEAVTDDGHFSQLVDQEQIAASDPGRCAVLAECATKAKALIDHLGGGCEHMGECFYIEQMDEALALLKAEGIEVD